MPWSSRENQLIVADYFAMLIKELNGLGYSKAEHRRNIAVHLNNRSKGSIEFKHQNISAILARYGIPFIRGYKPRWNYQTSLEVSVLNYLRSSESLEAEFQNFAYQDFSLETPNFSYRNWLVPPPEPTLFREPQLKYKSPVKRNYLEMEQRNQSIGEAGEYLVLEYEKWLLMESGYSDLAREIVWVSKEEGDGAGFDILSKHSDGGDKFIEVKSTTLRKETPIYLSKTENDFSIQHADSYHLYRVFNLRNKPGMFQRKGKFQDICELEAVGFKGYFG